jgi:hypothetical protein
LLLLVPDTLSRTIFVLLPIVPMPRTISAIRVHLLCHPLRIPDSLDAAPPIKKNHACEKSVESADRTVDPWRLARHPIRNKTV